MENHGTYNKECSVYQILSDFKGFIRLRIKEYIFVIYKCTRPGK